MDTLVNDVYKKLTDRKFRTGPLPDTIREKHIKSAVIKSIEKNAPIKILQFWGGCKNSNLGIVTADEAEQATLKNLANLSHSIQTVYQPGLQFTIIPGDSRVERINFAPREKTQAYVLSLQEMATEKQYNGIFTVKPLSDLYLQYQNTFESKLRVVSERLQKVSFTNIELLQKNAAKNIHKTNQSEISGELTSANAAINYLIYRAAEEETNIFQEFSEHIRSFFIRYISFYKEYIDKAIHIQPTLDCSIFLYTGGKGNITQPWQALGKKINGQTVFLSQERLRRIKTLS